MKKVIKISESDLVKIIKRSINEIQWRNTLGYNDGGPSPYSNNDLEDIRDYFIRFKSESNDVGDYKAARHLYYYAGGDKRTLNSLIEWLESTGVEISEKFKRYILSYRD